MGLLVLASTVISPLVEGTWHEAQLESFNADHILQKSHPDWQSKLTEVWKYIRQIPVEKEHFLLYGVDVLNAQGASILQKGSDVYVVAFDEHSQQMFGFLIHVTDQQWEQVQVGRFENGQIKGDVSVYYPGGDKVQGYKIGSEFVGTVIQWKNDTVLQETWVSGKLTSAVDLLESLKSSEAKASFKARLQLQDSWSIRRLVFPEGVYIGETMSQLPVTSRHNFGVFLWTSGPNAGDVFDGEWDNNQRANGSLYLSTGARYAGSFYHEAIEQGTYAYANGDVYTGSWSANSKLRGSFRYSNGDLFTGSFANDQRSSGSLKFATGELFEGDFNGGMLGKGKFTFADGLVSIVNYKDNMSAFDILIWPGSGESDTIAERRRTGTLLGNKIHGTAKLYGDRNFYGEETWENGVFKKRKLVGQEELLAYINPKDKAVVKEELEKLVGELDCQVSRKDYYNEYIEAYAISVGRMVGDKHVGPTIEINHEGDVDWINYDDDDYEEEDL